MLVLSRKENERIVFPGLGISVNVLRVQGRMVRLGVDAPEEVRVLRHELSPRSDATEKSDAAPAAVAALAPPAPPALSSHEMRNRINTANLALHMAQLQLERGESDKANEILGKALQELSSLDALLPVSPAEEPVTEVPVEAKPRSVRILLVEDQLHERELLADVLRMHGYEVDVAEDGEQALEYLASNHRPHVVLLDMNMPRMDGAETLAAIRANPRWDGLRVCAVSGANRSEFGIEVNARGINRWFSKPFDLRSFLQNLDEEISSVKA